MRFTFEKEDKKWAAVGLVLIVLIGAITCYAEFYLLKPEKMIQSRLNAYGFPVTEVNVEQVGESVWGNTYTLLDPPFDLQTGVFLANWTIMKGGSMRFLAIASCTDVVEANEKYSSAEKVDLTPAQKMLLDEYEKLTDEQKQELFIYLRKCSVIPPAQ